MKVSVSLPEDDLAYLDLFAREAGGLSRSAAMHEAIEALRGRGLAEEYAAAFEEWESSGEAQVWDAVAGDGIGE